MQSLQTAITCPPYRGTRRTRGTPPRVSWPATVHRLRSPAFLSLTPPVNCRTRGTRRCANPWHTLQTHPSRAAYTPPTLYPRSPLPSSPPLEGEKQSNPAHPVSAAKHPTAEPAPAEPAPAEPAPAEPAPAEPAPSTRAGCARFLLLTRRVNRATHCALTPLCYLRATPAHTSPALRIVVSSSHPACNAHPTDAPPTRSPVPVSRLNPPPPAEHHYTPPAPTCWPATVHPPLHQLPPALAAALHAVSVF